MFKINLPIGQIKHFLVTITVVDFLLNRYTLI